jgi:hypothetical protein
MSLLLNQLSLTDLFNLFLCNQGIKTVAKETEDEVKRQGVKASKDDGVEGGFVSFRQACHYYSINRLLLICSISFSAIRVSKTSQRKRRMRSSTLV